MFIARILPGPLLAAAYCVAIPVFHAFMPRCDKALERIRATVRQGWALGSERFLNRVEAQLGRSARSPKRGRPFKQADADEASRKMLI